MPTIDVGSAPAISTDLSGVSDPFVRGCLYGMSGLLLYFTGYTGSGVW